MLKWSFQRIVVKILTAQNVNIYFDLIFYLVALEAIGMINSIFGNSVVIYVMCCEKKLRRKSTYYIVSVTIADLLTSLLVVALAIICSLQCWKFSSFIYSSYLMLTIVSVLHMMRVSVDRYWAVCHPISYHTRSFKSAKINIMMCWAVGIMFGSTPVLSYESNEKCAMPIVHNLILSVLCVGSALVISTLYGLIFKTFRMLVRFRILKFKSNLIMKVLG